MSIFNTGGSSAGGETLKTATASGGVSPIQFSGFTQVPSWWLVVNGSHGAQSLPAAFADSNNNAFYSSSTSSSSTVTGNSTTVTAAISNNNLVITLGTGIFRGTVTLFYME